MGIQVFSYDVKAQKLAYIDTVGDYKSMSNIVIDGNILFACVESKKDDLVLAYRIEKDGSLVLLDTAHTEGYNICNLALDKAGKHLIACNFESCSVSVLRYDENGTLTLTGRWLATDLGSFETGHSNTDRQDKPYIHCAHIMPDGSHICVCNMGSDKVHIFRLDRGCGTITACPDLTVAIDGGEGARHIIFSEDGKFAYLNTEMGNTVYVFSVGEDGSLTRLQKVETLKPGVENPAKGWCSVVVMSRDGRYLYAGNRGQNNIAGFEIGEDGLLAGIGFFDCYGESPRGLNFGAGGEVLFCSCSGSNSLSVIACDRETGRLGRCLQRITTIPGSSCAVWCAVET